MSRVTREPKKAGLDRVKGMNSNWDNKCWDKIPRNRKALSLISRCGDSHLGEEQSECSALSSLSLPPPGCRSTRTVLDFNHLKKGAQHGPFSLQGIILSLTGAAKLPSRDTPPSFSSSGTSASPKALHFPSVTIGKFLILQPKILF